MKTYQEMSKEELTQELTALKAEYEKIKLPLKEELQKSLETVINYVISTDSATI